MWIMGLKRFGFDRKGIGIMYINQYLLHFNRYTDAEKGRITYAVCFWS
jgi:hypothetical protein